MIKILLLAFSISLTYGIFSQNSSLPITLSAPFDKDTIEETTPNFSWQANLTSIQNDIRISQVIIVTRIESNQTASESIIENDPIFYMADLTSNTVQYSEANTKLKQGETYAWQILYLYNDVKIQQSDVWQFTISKKTPPLNEFVAVRLKNDGSSYPIYNKRLNVLITEAGELSTKAIIFDEEGKSTSVQFLELVDGDFIEKETSISSTQTRYFSIDLKEYKFKKGNFSVEWPVKKGIVYTLNFVID